MQLDSNETLKLRIERTEKTSREDVEQFYIRVYKMAENLGFNVVSREENNKIIAQKGDKKIEENKRI
jgi:uncharacterized protein (DUF302 family)